MPWTDWQFWIVTVAAVLGARFILRQILPGRRDDAAVCGSCAVGAAACATPDEEAPAGSELPVTSSRQ